MIVQTQNTANSFTALCWIENGGSAIGVDAAPTNLASVPAARRITTPPGIFVTSALSLAAYAYDGSSTCIVRFWWYDHVQLIWIPNGNLGTLTTASTNSLVQSVGCMPGALFYCQVTANAGGVTKIAFTLR